MAHLVVWRGRWVKEFSHCGFPLCSLICKIYEISSLHMLFSLGSFFFFYLLALFSFWHLIYLPYFSCVLLSTTSLDLVCKIKLTFFSRIVHLPVANTSLCFSLESTYHGTY